MTLSELIGALEAEDPDLLLPLGFSNPHSYRGIYEDLAFEPVADVTIGQMLADARSALDATYEAWKGGEYTMREYADCWLAEEGRGGGETIGPFILALLIVAAQADEPTKARLRLLVSAQD